ncbi:MAG: diacylglycerol O-acyltransferase 1 [Geoglossum umbratile]|nr:MAG: diacylglycerol O-acyltransferase 1 [Geoglossum umbratile]
MESLFSQPQHEAHVRGIRGIFEDDDEAAESLIREPVEKNRWSSIMVMESAEPPPQEAREQLHLLPKSYADAAAEGLDAQSRGNATDTSGSSVGTGSDEKPESYAAVAAEGTKGTSGSGYGNTAQRLNGTMREDASTDIGNENIGDVPYNGVIEDEDDDASHRGGLRNGRLTTINRPHRDEQNGRKVTRREKPKTGEEKPPLVSGRRAGAGWGRSGVRFAPLNVPLKRRLQTAMVLFHTLSIATFLTFFWFLCAIPLTWPLLVPYLIYLLLSTGHSSGTLSHRSEFLRRLSIWSLFASYFPARLHRSEELPATRKYIFGYHPHGIISHGAFAGFATEALGFSQLFPGIKNTLLTLESNFRIPIYRDYLLAMGLASVSRISCENILSKGGPNGEGMGRAITIVVGGARESLDAQPGTLRLVLRSRKGFIKLAVRTGADLVPVLAFGENELYEQLIPEHHTWIHKFQMAVKRLLGFTIPLFHARGVFNYDVGLMPYRRPVNIVVGRPIKVERQTVPEEGYVNSVHEEYVRELERLWEEWREDFGGGDVRLEIVG